MRTIVLAALSFAAITTSSHAAVIGTIQLDGTIGVVTTDETAPGPGYTLRGCGNRPDNGQRVCTWVPTGTASAPVPATPAPAQPTQVASRDVSERGNPLIGNQTPDSQVACQASADSFRCAQVRPKATAFDWAMGIGSLFIAGEAVAHNGYYGSGYSGGYVGGSFIPPDAVVGTVGGQRRR